MNKYHIRLKVRGHWYFVKDHTNEKFIITNSPKQATEYTYTMAERLITLLEKWLQNNTEDHKIVEILP